MSLVLIKDIFAGVGTYDAWSLQLIKINNSRRDGTSYLTRDVEFSPNGKIASFLKEVAEGYIKPDKGTLSKYQDVREYDGTSIDRVVYTLDSDNELIKTEYEALIGAIAAPDGELDPLSMKAQAYLIKGLVTIGDEQHSVKFISMQKPVTNLKHKFLRSSGTFREINEQVISLRSSIDVIIYDNKIYMLTLAGENLFNMERAYKATCNCKVDEVKAIGIISDPDSFSNIACNGHNPRKFVSFNEKRLEKLKNANTRKKVSRQFDIPMNGDQFDTSTPEASDKLIKVLCNRGMMDPFEDNPVEVDGSKKWE